MAHKLTNEIYDSVQAKLLQAQKISNFIFGRESTRETIMFVYEKLMQEYFIQENGNLFPLALDKKTNLHVLNPNKKDDK